MIPVTLSQAARSFLTWIKRFMSVIGAVDGSSTRHVSAMDVGAAEAPTIWRS